MAGRISVSTASFSIAPVRTVNRTGGNCLDSALTQPGNPLLRAIVRGPGILAREFKGRGAKKQGGDSAAAAPFDRDSNRWPIPVLRGSRIPNRENVANVRFIDLNYYKNVQVERSLFTNRLWANARIEFSRITLPICSG